MVKSLKAIGLIVGGVIFLFVLLLLIFDSSSKAINCVAINELNGDVAISFYQEPYAYVKVFDSNGTEKFTRGLDSAGGLITHMYFDEDILHVQNTRMSREILYDRNGEFITAFDQEFPLGFYWDGWQKEGSQYFKQVGKVTYVYDYPNFIETLLNPLQVFYLVNKCDEKILLWTSQ